MCVKTTAKMLVNNLAMFGIEISLKAILQASAQECTVKSESKKNSILQKDIRLKYAHDTLEKDV